MRRQLMAGVHMKLATLEAEQARRRDADRFVPKQATQRSAGQVSIFNDHWHRETETTSIWYSAKLKRYLIHAVRLLNHLSKAPSIDCFHVPIRPAIIRAIPRPWGPGKGMHSSTCAMRVTKGNA